MTRLKRDRDQLSFDLEPNNIIEVPIDEAIPRSMMLYSEHVILERALPRVEDGLKPVQRRILYTMYDLGIKPDTDYKKSARIVGDCLGKYHPHGDQSVYDAMVRLGQDFNMRNVLVDGQGNFGSIDGDSAAAMRYTEARLAPLSMELLRDIDKKSIIDWKRNFDDTLQEPDVLPGRFPNILVNGSDGIAIGLATKIPSHNLTEVLDGCIAMIERPNIKLEELIEIIKGPDFPTGGFLVSNEEMISAYETGKGRILLRGKMEIENTDGGRQNIIISEIPYPTTKATIVKRIYDLKGNKKHGFDDVVDVDDESDRKGMRIVVRLKKGSDATKMLNAIYKNTTMECYFHANMVAIASGRPKQMGLIQILKYYLEFQRKVILRRSQHDIGVARTREHILEGYQIVFPDIDEVIRIIRASSSRAEAKKGLREKYELSSAQADAVLAIPLGSINKLDVEKFMEELAALQKLIAKLAKIIGSVREQDKVIIEEMKEIRDRYRTKRLTTIINDVSEIDITAYDPTQKASRRCYISIGALGDIKQLSSRNYLTANREISDKGFESISREVVLVEPGSETLIFGSLGNCYKLDTQKVQERLWDEKGQSLEEIYGEVGKGEKVVSMISYMPEDNDKLDKEVFTYTKNGMVKRTSFENYIVNRETYQYMRLADGDEVIGVEIALPDATILYVSSDGQCVNSETNDIPLQGRIAGGVIVMNINEGERAVYAGQADVEYGFTNDGEAAFMPLGEIVLVADNGKGKRVIASEFYPMKRNRKGLRIMDVYNESAKVIFARKVLDSFDVVFVDEYNNVKSINTEDIRIEGKDTKGSFLVSGSKLKAVFAHYEDMTE